MSCIYDMCNLPDDLVHKHVDDEYIQGVIEGRFKLPPDCRLTLDSEGDPIIVREDRPLKKFMANDDFESIVLTTTSTDGTRKYYVNPTTGVVYPVDPTDSGSVLSTTTGDWSDSFTYTPHWSWDYAQTYSMYCKCCGEEVEVSSVDFRLDYVCDYCKTSVPLLIIMKSIMHKMHK